MDGLEPLVEWLNQPHPDWMASFPDFSVGDHTLDDLTKPETTTAQETHNDERLLDWSWDEEPDDGTAPAPAPATTEEQAWRREAETLRNEITR